MITKNTLSALNKEINTVLKEVGERHGVVLHTGNCSYDRDGRFATIKLEAKVVNEDGKVFNKEAEDFKDGAILYGFKPDDLGKQFSMGGKRFKITGLNTRAHKTPILGEEIATGRKYRFGIEIKKLIQ